MSAFFLYSQANRTRVKDENPTASFGEIVSSECVMCIIAVCIFVFNVFVQELDWFQGNRGNCRFDCFCIGR